MSKESNADKLQKALDKTSDGKEDKRTETEKQRDAMQTRLDTINRGRK